MSYIIRVYYLDKIYSIDLLKHGNASIGSANDDSVRLDAHDLVAGHIKFINTNGSWIVKAKKLMCRENSRISSEELYEGITYIVQTEPQIFISVHPKQENSSKLVDLGNINEINIGRDARNEIVFSNMRTSSKHCQIYKVGEGFKIKDCGSKNGTFVNGKRISEKILCDGDIVNISIYQIIYENNTLSFLNVGNDIDFKIATIERDERVSIYENSDKASERRSNTVSLFGDNEEKKKGTVSVFDF